MKRLILCVVVICSITAVPVCSIAQQRVGINTTTPGATLDVNGTIKTDSILIPATHYYMYATPKTDTIMLGPAAFQRGGTTSGYIIYDVRGQELHFNGVPSAVIGYCVAPLSLPNGAHIINVTGYVIDNTPAMAVSLGLYATDVTTGTNTQVATAITPGDSPAITTLSLSVPYTVDNTTKTNSIRVILGNDATPLSYLYGVRVIYTVGHVN